MNLFADLVLKNGNIATMDDNDRFVQCLAVRDSRITSIGDDSDVRHQIGPKTEVINLQGATAIPGIIDSHCHPDSYAARIMKWHDLGPDHIRSRKDLLSYIEKACKQSSQGAWFMGYRFNENKSGGYPTLEEMNSVTNGKPLFILRTDGHLGLANSKAFENCSITTETNDPPFGRFDRNPSTGALTGLVRETAAHIFLEQIHSQDTPDDIAEGLVHVLNQFLSYGITSVYNSLTGRSGIRAYQLMHQQGSLKCRIGIIVSGREKGLVESYIDSGITSGFGNDWLRIIGVEWCPDCSTSGRTAAYYEPYQGTPIHGEPTKNTGMLLYELDDLRQRALSAHQAGLQVMIEGVGDRGIDFALDVIEHVLEEHPVKEHRMRIEHCCYVTPKQLSRIQRLKVIDSSATGFMYELGDAYRANRGKHAMKWMWPHRTLIDLGIAAPGHSDAWVCTPNPFTAMWSMVNRVTDTGQSLDKSQCISITEALRAYTSLAAYSGYEECSKGRLLPGMLADIAVLDHDIFSISPEFIKDIKVMRTIVGGSTVYQC